MVKNKGEKYIAHIGLYQPTASGKEAIIFVQHSDPRNFKDAMKEAREAEGWVEEDGVLAHVDSGTRIDLTKLPQ